MYEGTLLHEDINARRHILFLPEEVAIFRH